MINSKELMLGNYVQDIVSGEWMIVDEIGEKTGAVLINRDRFPLPAGWQMGPIELTKEVFEKTNLKGDGILFCTPDEIHAKMKGDNGLTYNSFFFNVRLGKWMDSQTRKTVTTLHELQNYYFLMSGEQLIIKP